MPTLDLTVRRKNRHEDTFQANGDPDDDAFAGWLQDQLRGWLRSNGWHESRWGDFEIEAREHKGWTKHGTARAQ